MASQNLKVKSGNRIVVMLDGQQVGLIQSIDASDDMGPEPASGVGDIHAVEYVPSMARHTLQVEEMVLRNGNLRQAGISIENGDGALQGMVFDILIMSKDDGSMIRKYTGCSFASGSVNVRKHAIVVSNATFNALDASGTGG